MLAQSISLPSRYLGLWRFALKRLRSEPALTLALLCGWVMVVALTAALPMYTDAVNRSQLQQELEGTELRNRPAFTFFYHYTSGSTGGTDWEHYQAAHDYMTNFIADELGLPVQGGLHYVKSDILQVFPSVGGSYNIGRDQPLLRGYLGFVEGIEKHITLVDGQIPPPTNAAGGPIAVLIHQDLASETGLQVGEELMLFDPSARLPGGGRKRLELPVRIAGIWTPDRTDRDFWSMSPAAFANVFLLPATVYVSTITPFVPHAYSDIGWYKVFNGDSVRSERVGGFLARVNEVNVRVQQRLPNTYLEFSPLAALTRYQRAASAQAVLLLIFGLPILGLILYFIVLIADSAVKRQQTEISILKSRGASSSQLLVVYALQGLTLGLVALLVGPWLGRAVATAIGSTYHFLAFQSGPPLQVAVTQRSLYYGLGALVLALLATLQPAIEAARLTIVAAKQESGRSQRSPFWQRAYLDLLLLLVAGYGFYLLKTQGRIAFLQGSAPADPLENPLLFLAPTLFIFAAALFCVRLFPLVARFLGWLWAQLGGVALLLALYNLGRANQNYASLLLLLILTTGLGTFTASMARTLDENLVARAFYQIGADLALTEGVGVVQQENNAGETAGSRPEGSRSPTVSDEPPAIWINMPVEDHRRATGVKAATRIGQFEISTSINNQVLEGVLYGIDRADFPAVAYFRPDFSASSLGALMNALAVEFSGVIVSRAFLEQTQLAVGDAVVLRGLIATSNQGVTFQIVGATDLFPTAYPQNGAFFIANLDYIFEALGQELPYTVWLATEEGVKVEELTAQLNELGYRVLGVQDARALITKAQRKPGRIGLFGFLSVGFVATTGLSMLALIIYAVLSFRQRFVQLGILRAIGLSSRQLALSLGSEQILITATGIAIGSYLGLLSSYLFIPFLQVGYTPADLFPPFVVRIAWNDVSLIVIVLVAMLLVATLSVVWLLLRMKMFQAVKLGEAV